ncbi:hypothetical protein NUU61_010040 [Penicillium alfredii]|uniref:Uncharacterized protein n=1 Tax=Penicillium alfredii TaxID=1506179 RepID=A0A9W9EHE1_9EURO|nr:uncharacterized protein NUU61_010040 [Penicillium alfredii]KAJ5081776.1 hypothetical protein NUU61_010040 [Penicillium alfredii]
MEDQRQSQLPEGIWMLDASGKRLRQLSDDELARAPNVRDDTTSPDYPSSETIAEYLSSLSPSQQGICDAMRGMGWPDPAIHNLLTLVENTQNHLCAQLRMQGVDETEIQSLDEICNQDMPDLSHLRDPSAEARQRDFQLQLYLLDDVTRRRRVMLGKE